MTGHVRNNNIFKYQEQPCQINLGFLYPQADFFFLKYAESLFLQKQLHHFLETEVHVFSTTGFSF